MVEKWWSYKWFCYSISNYLFLHHEYFSQTEIVCDSSKTWKSFALRNKKGYLKYVTNKQNKVLNIVVTIRNQIFKTFIWTIPSKLGIDYDRIKTFNSSMIETMSWNIKYLMINNNEVINRFAIQ